VIDDDTRDVFRALNAQPRRVPEAERRELIEKHFPSVVTLSWFKAMLVDPVHVFGEIMRDIHRHDARPEGHVGRSGTPDLRVAMARHRQFMGDDYSVLVFHEAFQALAGWQPAGPRRRGGRVGIATVARRIGRSRAETHRLLTGAGEPTVATMTAVAVAYGKDPSYFVEYRKVAVLKAMARSLARTG
jgi:hypothetical protein